MFLFPFYLRKLVEVPKEKSEYCDMYACIQLKISAVSENFEINCSD